MTRRSALAALVAAAGVVALWSAAAGAGPGTAASGYADSVDAALRTLRDARGDDRAAALRAADELEAGTGQSQREILAELRQDPPDVADATARLAALSRADRSPAFAPEPARARRAVDDILAQPRYAPLRQGPSLGDRIRDALVQLLAWVLDQAGAAITGGVALALGAAGLAGLALVTVLVVRSNRWRGRREAVAAGGAATVRGGPDRFGEADRLADSGDLAGAVRALAGAVAGSLGGERAWEASPLTVRELFARAPDPRALRPLLLAFEAVAYADRAPDADAYRRALAAAAPHRPAGRAAA